MMRSVVLAAMMTLTAACSGTPSGASTASLSPSSSVSSTVTSATSTTAAPSSALSSQSTSSAATTAAPGTVVHLPQGVYFQTAADITATSWLTSDEKTFLVSELARVQSGNTCVALFVSGYRVADLTDGQIFFGGPSGTCGPGRGGVALLWGKVSGTWKVVAMGQNPPMCTDIRTAGWTSTIPKDFFGGQCYEKGSQTLVDYKP
jgi:hypothetical protein